MGGDSLRHVCVRGHGFGWNFACSVFETMGQVIRRLFGGMWVQRTQGARGICVLRASNTRGRNGGPVLLHPQNDQLLWTIPDREMIVLVAFEMLADGRTIRRLQSNWNIGVPAHALRWPLVEVRSYDHNGTTHMWCPERLRLHPIVRDANNRGFVEVDIQIREIGGDLDLETRRQQRR